MIILSILNVQFSLNLLSLPTPSTLAAIIQLSVSMNFTTSGASYKWNYTLFFRLWLLSLRIMSLSFIYVWHMSEFHSFLRMNNIPLYIIFHLSIDGNYHCFHLLVLGNYAILWEAPSLVRKINMWTWILLPVGNRFSRTIRHKSTKQKFLLKQYIWAFLA